MIKNNQILSAGILNLLRYNRKFVIAVFVICDNFIKNFIRTLPGLKKEFVIAVNLLYPCSL